MPFDFPNPFEPKRTTSSHGLPKLAEGVLGSAGRELVDLLDETVHETEEIDEAAKVAQDRYFLEDRRETLYNREADRLSAFFGREIPVDSLPPEITPERIDAWREQGFELHFLPEIPLRDGQKNWKEFPSWVHKPAFPSDYDEKIDPRSFGLRKGWVLWDERTASRDEDRHLAYDQDPFAEIITHLRASGLINKQLTFGFNPREHYPYTGDIPEVRDKATRFNIPAVQLRDPTIRNAFAEVLNVPAEKLRLPYFLEDNLLRHLHRLPELPPGLSEYYQDDVINKKYGDMVVNGRSTGDLGIGAELYFSSDVGFRFAVQISE